MRKKIIAANWKMHGSLEWIGQYFADFFQLYKKNPVECVFFPPYVYIPSVLEQVRTKSCVVGAQNVYWEDSGAFTGEVSAPMLKDLGCQYVLIGHSERRHLFAENEKNVADKFHHAKEHGMIPVLCVGETLEEREKGLAARVLARQLATVLLNDKKAFDNAVIAYEPVWAIGTGQTASPEQAQQMHATIRQELTEISECRVEEIPIIYGGSVNEKNAKALFSMPDVDGGLVGGASLDAQKFLDIVECIR